MQAATARETVTIPEASALLGIHQDLGYRLAQAGKFPVATIRLGRKIVVPRRALMRLLEGQQAESAR
jgi:excisionase family DNA binding protein